MKYLYNRDSTLDRSMQLVKKSLEVSTESEAQSTRFIFQMPLQYSLLLCVHLLLRLIAKSRFFEETCTFILSCKSSNPRRLLSAGNPGCVLGVSGSVML